MEFCKLCRRFVDTRRSLSLVPQSGVAYSLSHLARFACARLALRAHKNYWKKSVSQSTQNALKRLEIKKKMFTPMTHYARSAKPERHSAMKFWYNQSDQSSNIFTKFDQNPTHCKRDISRKSGTDTHTRTNRHTDRRTHTHTHIHTHTHTHTDKVCRSLQSTNCDDSFHLWTLEKDRKASVGNNGALSVTPYRRWFCYDLDAILHNTNFCAGSIIGFNAKLKRSKQPRCKSKAQNSHVTKVWAQRLKPELAKQLSCDLRAQTWRSKGTK